MAVLVTGGAGYIGSHTALALLERNEDVVILDDLSTGSKTAVSSRARFVHGDCGDEQLLDALFLRYDIEAIVHFAARIVVPESVADPLAYYLSNTAKSRTLIACAVKAGIRRFVFSSTAAVYGEPRHIPVVEDAVLAPISPYGRSKLVTEWMLQDADRAHGLRSATLRYFNVAGADPHGRVGQSSVEATHLVKVAVQAALGRRDGMEIFGLDYDTPDGSCLRDYIHVSDLAQAHVDALDYLADGRGSITCNVGYERGFSVLEVIEMVKQVSGCEFSVRRSPRRPGDPAAIVAANGRIRSELGWLPRYDHLKTIVVTALDWERRLMCRNAAAPIDVDRMLIEQG